MKLAEKFNKPIFTLIDTPGAFPGIEAEERGQGEAIAKNLKEICKILESEIKGNEIIVTQGAGNIVDISNSIKAIYK